MSLAERKCIHKLEEMETEDGIVYADLDLSQRVPGSTNLPQKDDDVKTVYASIRPQSAQENLDAADNLGSVGPNSREMIELTSKNGLSWQLSLSLCYRASQSSPTNFRLLLDLPLHMQRSTLSRPRR